MDTFTFFRALFEDAEQGWLTLWTRQDKKSYWFQVSELDKVAWTALKLSKQNRDVYFGVGLRREKVYKVSEDGKEYLARGDSTDVIAIPGLWMDIDVANVDAHTETALPKTIQEAVDFMLSFKKPPTIMVNSGHGLHSYWLFPRTMTLANEDDREWASDLLKSFQWTVKYEARQKGWKLDTTSDLARVLRVPGTTNYKAEPKRVEVIQVAPSFAAIEPE